MARAPCLSRLCGGCAAAPEPAPSLCVLLLPGFPPAPPVTVWELSSHLEYGKAEVPHLSNVLLVAWLLGHQRPHVEITMCWSTGAEGILLLWVEMNKMASSVSYSPLPQCLCSATWWTKPPDVALFHYIDDEDFINSDSFGNLQETSHSFIANLCQ